ncbi:hypothetical protein NA57DRAFT_54482 [Rhizodiscina lignyota]|uniref:Uncharacterized protein n=1 Tax=Rhizodiscina lignyota TaxID=1504668 RepID=A0A9P4M769_9PEZI|nr:hypothetical protein NA57DRAFT_54482 [Rhizodiscina lignyota]
MASKVCCTAPQRSGSPDLPNARTSAAVGTAGSEADGPIGSTATSTRTEDREDIRRIFNGADEAVDNLAELGDIAKGNESLELPRGDSPKPPSIVGKLRKRLLKGGNRSQSLLKDDAKPRRVPKPRFLRERDSPEVKNDLRENLLNEGSPGQGGYDPDAESVAIRESLISAPQNDLAVSPVREKKIPRRSPLQDIEWRTRSATSMFCHTPDGDVRVRNASRVTVLPYSQSRPSSRRQSYDDRKNIRRSRSESSLAHAVPVPLNEGQRINAASMSEPYRELLLAMPPSNSEGSNRVPDSSASEYATARASQSSHSDLKPNETVSTEKSFDIPRTVDQSRADCSETQIIDVADDEAGTESDPLRDSEASKAVSRTNSVHLYSMRISQHLRSTSMFSDHSERQIQSPTAEPLQRTQSVHSVRPSGEHPVTQHHRQQSSSGFTSTKVPSAWGNVVQDQDQGSSVYSSRVHTPADSPFRPYCSSPDLTGTYEISSALLPRSDFPRIRLETSTGAQTIRQRRPASKLATAQNVESVNSSPSKEAPGIAKELQSNHLDSNSNSAEPSDNYDADESSRSSRFVEELHSTPPKSLVRNKKPSIFSLFSRKSKAVVIAESTTVNAIFDGPADDLQVPRLTRSSLSLRGNDEASNLFAKALVANQEEKNALLLPCNRERGNSMSSLHAPRGRSASVSTKDTSRAPSAAGSLHYSPSKSSVAPSRASPYAKPVFSTPQFLSPSYEEGYFDRPRLQSGSTFLDPLDTTSVKYSPKAPSISVSERRVSTTGDEYHCLTPQSDLILPELVIAPPQQGSSEDSLSKADLGSWGRYPSHTRDSRIGPAGQRDRVTTRDFAYELHVQEPEPIDEDVIESDPQGRKLKNKQKSDRVSSNMSKTRSTSFGRRLIRGYSAMFKSQSLEFLRHGHGHRSSISAGGVLEHPELEMLPPIFPAYHADHYNSINSNNPAIEMRDMNPRSASVTSTGHDGSNDSTKPMTQLDGQFDEMIFPTSFHTPTHTPAPNAARIWSQLYASCVELPSSRCDSPVDLDATLRPQSSVPTSCTVSRQVSPCLNINFSRPISRTLPRVKSPSLDNMKPDAHRRNASVVSAMSLRASTNDLCRLLVEAEESERARVLKVAAGLVSGSTA